MLVQFVTQGVGGGVGVAVHQGCGATVYCLPIGLQVCLDILAADSFADLESDIRHDVIAVAVVKAAHCSRIIVLALYGGCVSLLHPFAIQLLVVL